MMKNVFMEKCFDASKCYSALVIEMYFSIQAFFKLLLVLLKGYSTVFTY